MFTLPFAVFRCCRSCQAGANPVRVFPVEGETAKSQSSRTAPTYHDSVQHSTYNADGADQYPNNEEGVTSHGGAAELAKASVHGSEIEMRYDAFVWVDFLRKKWILFFLGNIISAAVVVCELFRVDSCFDDVTERRVAGTIGITRDIEASLRFVVIAILVFGLVTEMAVAVVLSCVYRSPLDIKSMTKITPGDIRGCETSVVVNLLAPFSWGIIYTCGSFVSLQLDTFSSCGGQAGSGLSMYLLISGWGMLVVGLGMLGLSAYLLVFIFSCCPTVGSRTKKCCVAERRMYGRRIFSNAALLALFWKVQGAVWLYRTGGVGLRVLVLLVVLGVVGGGFAAVGSRAPPATTRKNSSDPSLVATQAPNATDSI